METLGDDMLGNVRPYKKYLYNCNCNTQKDLQKNNAALLQALESARAFIYRHSQSDCNTGELICKKTEAELIKIDAAIAAARGTV